MSGRWRVDPGELIAHDHLVIETAAGRRLALNDPRRFGFLDLVPTDALATYPPFMAVALANACGVGKRNLAIGG